MFIFIIEVIDLGYDQSMSQHILVFGLNKCIKRYLVHKDISLTQIVLIVYG